MATKKYWVMKFKFCAFYIFVSFRSFSALAFHKYQWTNSSITCRNKYIDSAMAISMNKLTIIDHWKWWFENESTWKNTLKPIILVNFLVRLVPSFFFVRRTHDARSTRNLHRSWVKLAVLAYFAWTTKMSTQTTRQTYAPIQRLCVFRLGNSAEW